MKTVRALRRCFVENSLREEGDVFDVPDNTVMKSKGKDSRPVLEEVGAKKAPPPRRARPTETDEPDGGDDD